VTGGLLVKEARLRAGLTQRELAGRMGTRQPVIARWERGRAEPGFETVQRALRACGFDLEIAIGTRDDDHPRLIEDHLRMTVEERLDALENMLDIEAWARTARRVGHGV
jgi:transcriptional regulator with XRE-family HTH domain